jgi:hypothetical protein
MSVKVSRWRIGSVPVFEVEAAIVGANLHAATTFIRTVYHCNVPDNSMHSLITSTHRPEAHVGGANAK